MKADTIRFLLIPLVLSILLFAPANLLAYDYQEIFSDDFQDGSTQNWIQENGIWSAANFQFCVEEVSC